MQTGAQSRRDKTTIHCFQTVLMNVRYVWYGRLAYFPSARLSAANGARKKGTASYFCVNCGDKIRRNVTQLQKNEKGDLRRYIAAGNIWWGQILRQAIQRKELEPECSDRSRNANARSFCVAVTECWTPEATFMRVDDNRRQQQMFSIFMPAHSMLRSQYH